MSNSKRIRTDVYGIDILRDTYPRTRSQRKKRETKLCEAVLFNCHISLEIISYLSIEEFCQSLPSVCSFYSHLIGSNDNQLCFIRMIASDLGSQFITKYSQQLKQFTSVQSMITGVYPQLHTFLGIVIDLDDTMEEYNYPPFRSIPNALPWVRGLKSLMQLVTDISDINPNWVINRLKSLDALQKRLADDAIQPINGITLTFGRRNQRYFVNHNRSSQRNVSAIIYSLLRERFDTRLCADANTLRPYLRYLIVDCCLNDEAGGVVADNTQPTARVSLDLYYQLTGVMLDCLDEKYGDHNPVSMDTHKECYIVPAFLNTVMMCSDRTKYAETFSVEKVRSIFRRMRPYAPAAANKDEIKLMEDIAEFFDAHTWSNISKDLNIRLP